jgi:hypothetical protein
LQNARRKVLRFSRSYVFGLAAVAAIMVAATGASMSLKLVVFNERRHR